jgi:hypothetical protein
MHDNWTSFDANLEGCWETFFKSITCWKFIELITGPNKGNLKNGKVQVTKLYCCTKSFNENDYVM